MDLLGWGVPPAYLLDCGVSKEAIFYVFSELNLTLPEGFDVSGLIPYLPDFLPQSHHPMVMPPPLPDNRESTNRRSHPSNRSSISQPAVKPSVAPDTPLPLDLHDIERLRRQELLARKAAAQASRKLRLSNSLGSSDGSSTAKEVLTVTSATEAVDNFLNSIDAAEANNRTKSTSSEDMDVQTVHSAETHIRRLSSSSGSRSTPSHGTTSTVEPPAPTTDMSILADNGNVGLITSQPPPPSSSSSSATDSEVFPPTPRLEHSSVRSRRGLKRAVATDFDFDAVPRKSGLAYPPTKQPKTAFVTIASRRCVIDLSDSENEDGLSHHRPPHAPGIDQPVTQNDRKGKPTVISSPNAATTPSGTVPPSALLQKELEIQKMRELIARREEETRLKKLAVSPGYVPRQHSQSSFHYPSGKSSSCKHTLERQCNKSKYHSASTRSVENRGT